MTGKVVAPEAADDEELPASFRRESKVLRKLKHPNIVQYYGGGKDGDQPLYSRLWGSGFLPTRHQGVNLRAGSDPVLYLKDPDGIDREIDRLGARLGYVAASNNDGRQHSRSPLEEGGIDFSSILNHLVLRPNRMQLCLEGAGPQAVRDSLPFLQPFLLQQEETYASKSFLI